MGLDCPQNPAACPPAQGHLLCRVGLVSEGARRKLALLGLLLHSTAGSAFFFLSLCFFRISLDRFLKISSSPGGSLASFWRPSAQWDLHHCWYGVLAGSPTQLFTRGLVWTGSLLGTLESAVAILVLRGPHSEPQGRRPLSSLRVRCCLLPPDCVGGARASPSAGSWCPSSYFRLFPPSSYCTVVCLFLPPLPPCSAFCGGASSCPQSCGASASCPERCPWLGASWKEHERSILSRRVRKASLRK